MSNSYRRLILMPSSWFKYWIWTIIRRRHGVTSRKYAASLRLDLSAIDWRRWESVADNLCLGLNRAFQSNYRYVTFTTFSTILKLSSLRLGKILGGASKREQWWTHYRYRWQSILGSHFMNGVSVLDSPFESSLPGFLGVFDSRKSLYLKKGFWNVIAIIVAWYIYQSNFLSILPIRLPNYPSRISVYQSFSTF